MTAAKTPPPLSTNLHSYPLEREREKSTDARSRQSQPLASTRSRYYHKAVHSLITVDLFRRDSLSTASCTQCQSVSAPLSVPTPTASLTKMNYRASAEREILYALKPYSALK